MPQLTVREQLEFVASLTFASCVGPRVRRARIDRALADVALEVRMFAIVFVCIKN